MKERVQPPTLDEFLACCRTEFEFLGCGQQQDCVVAEVGAERDVDILVSHRSSLLVEAVYPRSPTMASGSGGGAHVRVKQPVLLAAPVMPAAQSGMVTNLDFQQRRKTAMPSSAKRPV